MFEEYQEQLDEIEREIDKISDGIMGASNASEIKQFLDKLKALLQRKQRIEYTLSQMATWQQSCLSA